jgi:hypothetical protein
MGLAAKHVRRWLMRMTWIGFVVAAACMGFAGSALAAGPAGAMNALSVSSLSRPMGIRAAESDGPATRNGTTVRIGGTGTGGGASDAIGSPLGGRMNRAVPQLRSTLTPLPR